MADNGAVQVIAGDVQDLSVITSDNDNVSLVAGNIDDISKIAGDAHRW